MAAPPSPVSRHACDVAEDAFDRFCARGRRRETVWPQSVAFA
eukprot:CAMPEP_0204573924 /NCGR_PEP_ID=MMETSP0661-20131031/40308_1 /ASSEMBLY_ACC=CAM_ASM_000606 /TAXON_ID=109239 /ORGANISM="Alexandrium margalefi, Strain AMGDE01CS-322" /LENGTH=41 /DNA_ID= /DNA_START= /DNA_END= /DNA_ORIENTATION=